MKITKIEANGKTRYVPYIEIRDPEKDLWGVFDSSRNRMNKKGRFSYEPSPSSRTDKWIKEHSFTFQEAIMELQKLELKKEGEELA